MEAQGRGTVDQLWVVHQVVERVTEYRTPLYLCFVDLTKAHNSINQQAMTAVLNKYRVPLKTLTRGFRVPVTPFVLKRSRCNCRNDLTLIHRVCIPSGKKIEKSNLI